MQYEILDNTKVSAKVLRTLSGVKRLICLAKFNISMAMRISNRFVIVCKIQIAIRMLYHSFQRLLLLSFFYLMVKSSKLFVKIGSRFQIALFFLFYRIFTFWSYTGDCWIATFKLITSQMKSEP